MWEYIICSLYIKLELNHNKFAFSCIKTINKFIQFKVLYDSCENFLSCSKFIIKVVILNVITNSLLNLIIY